MQQNAALRQHVGRVWSVWVCPFGPVDRAGEIQTKKNARRIEPGGVWQLRIRPEKPAGCGELLDCLAGNVLDVAAADTEVVQFAVAHAAKFVAGLTVLAPIVERASNVHDAGPFQGSCQHHLLAFI